MKCIISIGLLLFFVFLAPGLTPDSVSIAQASTIEKEKTPDYKLNLRSITLVKGKTHTLKVYNTSADAKVSFKSDDPEIASVSEDGTITANKVGSTKITAAIKDGSNSASLTCDVTIGPPAFSVKMTRSRIILGLDQTDTLSVITKPINTAENARFSSYDSSIASVSTGGRINAKKKGLTYLFAEIDALGNDGNKKFASCTIIITAAEDVAPITDYFNTHPELNIIPEAELSAALEKFFNSPDEKTNKAVPVEAGTPKTLVEALNQFLDSKFNLAALRKSLDDAVAQTQQVAVN